MPYKAKLFDEFLPEEELLPTMQAISRVFARLGEKRNRARARIKFLIAHLGIEEFKKLVVEERQKLAPDPRWTDYLAPSMQWTEQPLKPGAELERHQRPEGFEAWYTTNVYKQRQPGYVAATVSLPLGDASADQLRALADIARRFVKDTLRTTVEQNILFRWVSEADLPEFYQAIKAIGLGAADAATIVDVTSCPGTDTCKLGIASSRGLGAGAAPALGRKEFAVGRGGEKSPHQSQRLLQFLRPAPYRRHRLLRHQPQRERISGAAFPSGPGRQVSRQRRRVRRADRRGAVEADPRSGADDHRVLHAQRDLKDERFQAFIARIGKKAVKDLLEDLTRIPAHDVDRSFYSDWGDPREFTLADMGIGECAGEVVSQAEFTLAASERELFEAQLLLDARPRATLR